jgi:hypothetical protein
MTLIRTCASANRKKILLSLSVVFLVAFLISVQSASAARSFQLDVNLWDAKSDSGKVKVYVISHDTEKKKSKSLDVGRLVGKSGDTTVEQIVFRFNEKELPPNGEFSACAYSQKYDKTQCEIAERHHDARSAVMWVQVPK